MNRKTILLAVAAALPLAACGGGSDQPAAPETNVTETPLPPEAAPTNTVSQTAPPATVVDNTAQADAAPAAQADVPEQTQDYSDATGMTARVDRSESGSGNESGVPAQ